MKINQQATSNAKTCCPSESYCTPSLPISSAEAKFGVADAREPTSKL